MTRRISIEDLRANLVDLACDVRETREPIVIEQQGRPQAVLISPDQYARFEEFVEARFRAAVDELRRRNADLDPDEVYADVTAIVEQVRRERDERERRRPAE
jgi:prevent-host-death family protein